MRIDNFKKDYVYVPESDGDGLPTDGPDEDGLDADDELGVDGFDAPEEDGKSHG